MRTLVVALLLFAPLGYAAEAPSVADLQREVAALRVANADLQRENADLKARLAGDKPAAVASAAARQESAERQEDKPQNRIRLPSNVTINHNPR